MIAALIDSAVILDNLEAAAKEDALGSALQAAVDAGRLAKKDLTAVRKRLLEREAMGSTGIGNGIAVPHVKGKEIRQMSLVLARVPKTLNFQAIDGRPVHTIFLLLAPPDDPEAHLKLLRWISSLARNPDFRKFVVTAKDAKEIRELLHEMSGPKA
jgi:mannitol/fructose-specific phosphotransferase system IIA component (Ntr-type)